MLPLSNFAIPGVGLAAAGASLSGLLTNNMPTLPAALSGQKNTDQSFASVLNNQAPVNSDASKPTVSKTEKEIREAAKGFERTLIRQMLSTVRSTSLRGGEDQGETSKGYLEIADDKLADALVAGKGIGFATKVADQMLAQPNIKALIEAEKKAVNKDNTSNQSNSLNSVLNQYKKVSTF
jgi:Rod binding domain-containing protein